MTIITAANATYTIKIIKPGLYIEHIGSAWINRGTFRLNINIPKEQILTNIINANNTITELNHLCKETGKLSKNIHCTELVDHLKEEEEKFKWIFKSIKQSTAMQVLEEKRRRKRGLLGNMLTAVFGVNEEVYQDIDSLDRNQQKLIQDSSHQTRLLMSATLDRESSERRTNQTLQRFTDKLNQGIEAINDMKSWFTAVDRDHLNILFLNSYQLASNYIQEVQEQCNKILEAVNGQGHIYDFLSPAEVAENLQKASHKLPTNIQILQAPMMGTSVVQNDTNIMIYGHFLITDVTQFTLMKVTPIPIRFEGDQYWIPKVTNNILAINYNIQRYYEISDAELRRCLTLEKHFFITSPTVVHSIEHNPNCIIDQIYDRADKYHCPVQKITTTSIKWKQLSKQNTWMFITNKQTRFAVTCNGRREEVKVNQTGIISLTQDCSITTGQNILNPTVSADIPVLSTAIKALNISIDSEQFKIPTEVVKIEPIIPTGEQDNSMESTAKILDQTWSKVRHHSASTSMITTTGWFAVLLISTLLTKYLWQQYRTIPNRTQSRSTAEEFEMLPPNIYSAPAQPSQTRQNVQNSEQ